MSNGLEALLAQARPQVAVWYDRTVGSTPSAEAVEEFLKDALGYARQSLANQKPLRLPVDDPSQLPSRLVEQRRTRLIEVERAANERRAGVARRLAVTALTKVGVREDLAKEIVHELEKG